MNCNIVLIQFAILGFFALCNGQTFQYSEGWTAGKRSVNVPTNHDIFHQALINGVFEKFLHYYLNLPADPRLIAILMNHKNPNNGDYEFYEFAPLTDDHVKNVLRQSVKSN